MENVYNLTTYCYETYSFSGIEPCEIFIHKTREGAIAHAKDMGLIIVSNCNNPHEEATIDEIFLYN